ncbi:MAG TPA: hypothetical protein VL523_09780 [Terriglobia bacterium]|nr:hypothetical protein [Terriglobia bacterium]
MPAKPREVVAVRPALAGVRFKTPGRRPPSAWRRVRREVGGWVAYLFSWWRY